MPDDRGIDAGSANDISYDDLQIGPLNNIALPGFRVEQIYGEDSPTGFRAYILRNDAHEMIVVNRGTEPTSILDWMADLDVGRSQYRENAADIVNYINSQRAGDPSLHVTVTGHSLGGALAEYLAYDLAGTTTNDSWLSLRTVNGLGGLYGLGSLHPEGFDPNALSGVDVRHYAEDSDRVSRLGGGHLGGDLWLIRGETAGDDGVLGSHDRSYNPAEYDSAVRTALDYWDMDELYAALPDYGRALALLIGGNPAGALAALAGAAIRNPEATQFLLDMFEGFGVDAARGLDWLADNLPPWIDPISGDFAAAIAAALRRFVDPIVFDLDGDGVELISRADSRVYFDMDGDGRREHTGWVGPDDGLLVVDQDNDGLVESIDDLVGDLGQSGFAELATYDSNNDRVISAADTIWSRLRVWVDADSDGITDSGELRTMAQVGIRSIDLSFTTVSFTAEGNRIHEQATYERTNGTVRTVVDAWFDVDNVDTARDAVTTGNATVDALPDIPGNGDLPSLRLAMRADSALLSLVSSVVARTATQMAGIEGSIEQILYRWAGAQGIAVDSRGGLFDARALSVLEKMLGTPFVAGGDTNPNAQSIANLQAAWDNLVDGVTARLLLAGPIGALLPNTLYSPGIDAIVTLDTPATLLQQLAAGVPAGDALQVGNFWAAALVVAEEASRERGVDLNGAEYRTAVADALSPYGLDDFADMLSSGIDPLALAAGETVFGGNGVFSLTAGDDVLTLIGQRVAVYAGAGNDTVSAARVSGGPVLLAGGAGNDTLVGSGNPDWLDGEAGADLLYGGRGDDSYTVDNVGDRIVESSNAGNDLVRASISYVLGANLERLALLGTAALQGTGNAGNNELRGNAGNNRLLGLDGDDWLDGGVGSDTLEGGRGRDTYVLDRATDRIVETGTDAGSYWSPDWDVVRASFSYVAPDLIEEVELTGAGNIDATGNAGYNRLSGNAGNNILDGAGGDDEMLGGRGDDTYVVDSGNDRATDESEGGNDTVRASVSFTLGSYIENLLLTGAAAINGYGNELANALTGNAAANILDGRGGADRLKGGLGDDTYLVDDIGDIVTEGTDAGIDTVETSLAAYTLGSNLENLRLGGNWWETDPRNGTGNGLGNTIEGTEGANILGGLGGDDRLLGRGGIDTLNGGDGHDLLDGGGGADKMAGGTGDDSYYVDDAGDKVIEAAGEGRDRVYSQVGYQLTGQYAEILELVGSGDMDGTGNSLDNILVGNGWANNLDGGAGADTLSGGDGNDTYTVDNVGDMVVEDPGRGTDLVRASISYVLGAGLEHLTLLGTGALQGTGNAGNNELRGNSGNNRLLGLAGDDWLDGGAGTDTLEGGRGRDTYVLDRATDVIVETGTEGGSTGAADWDVVRASFSYIAPVLIEQIELTGAAHINATGNAAYNRLFGNAGDNVLDGATGDDEMWGGLGNDVFVVDSGNDRAYEEVGAGTDTVRASVSYRLGGAIENLLLTGTGDISAYGNELANALTGNAGNNLLDGEGGADRLKGGLGDDIYIVDNAGDVVTESADSGIDRVETTLLEYTLGSDIEQLRLVAGWGDTAPRNGTGNGLANWIEGTDGVNTLKGLGGNDQLLGRGGNDALNGADGNDLLDGGSGADAMAGGLGDDIYYVDDAGDKALELTGQGYDRVISQIGFQLTGQFAEALELVGNGDMDGTGNGLDNLLVGNAWANNLDGGAGADVMQGGDGNDTYTVDNAGDLVGEDPGRGTDLVRASISYVLGAGLENLTLLGTAALQGTGNAGGNELRGNSGANRLAALDGDDLLDGGAGADTLEGGRGRDTYVVDNAGDRVIETGTAASHPGDLDWDTVRSSVSFAAPTLVEQIELIGTAHVNATGNAGYNRLFGNAGNNILDGGAGYDEMYGGLGNDIYIVDTNDHVQEEANAGVDQVRASVGYTLGANVENLLLTGAAAIGGWGNALNNAISGNAAANYLDGREGADTMAGGAGDDSYVVDHAGDVVKELVDGGTDTVESLLATYTLGADVENLRLRAGGAFDTTARNGAGNALANAIEGNHGVNTIGGGAGDDLLSGLDGADTLNGGDGHDYLDGGSGGDRMTGGLGDDIYLVNEASDRVIEAENQGYDRVLSQVSFQLTGQFAEALELVGSGDMDGTGNALDNLLVGNDWANNLDGGAGADTLVGGGGNDTYTIDNIGDLVLEAPDAGWDVVRSAINYVAAVGVEEVRLLGTSAINARGNELDNVLVGNAGANRLAGGAGADRLTGGAGADRFVWNAQDELGNGPWYTDVVTDFSSAQGDKLDLGALDANRTTTANDAFVFIGAAAFTAAGQVRYYVSGTTTVIELNTDANLGTVDAAIVVEGGAAAAVGWFAL